VCIMSANNQNTKLLIAAAGSAIAGSLATVALLKLYSKKPQADTNVPPKDLRQRQSFLLLDESEQDSQRVLYPFNHEEKMRLKVAARQAVEEDNSLPRNSVTVRVPATSANMGPGCE
jgi:hypothetical protein